MVTDKLYILRRKDMERVKNNLPERNLFWLTGRDSGNTAGTLGTGTATGWYIYF